LPGDDGSDLHDADWSTVNAKLGNLPVLRLSNGYINPQGKPDALTVMYFVEGKTSLIRGRYHYSTLTVFNDLQPFGEKTIARKLTTLGGEVNKMEITIDTLGPAPNVSETLFSFSGVKPLYTSGEEDQRFTQPRAVYTVKPSISGWHGKATCGVKIDEHGHVRDVDVKGTTDESVIKPIRAALMNWEYEPATINGHPSLGFVQVVSPKEEEDRKDDMVFEGKLSGKRLVGITTRPDGTPWQWTGERAPSLKRKSDPKWGKPTQLFNGRDLNGWRRSDPESRVRWKVEDGALVSPGHGPELITDGKFEDFKLHVEFDCAPGRIAASTYAVGTNSRSKTIQNQKG
jgi:hypothetical protein